MELNCSNPKSSGISKFDEPGVQINTFEKVYLHGAPVNGVPEEVEEYDEEDRGLDTVSVGEEVSRDALRSASSA